MTASVVFFFFFFFEKKKKKGLISIGTSRDVAQTLFHATVDFEEGKESG